MTMLGPGTSGWGIWVGMVGVDRECALWFRCPYVITKLFMFRRKKLSADLGGSSRSIDAMIISETYSKFNTLAIKKLVVKVACEKQIEMRDGYEM